MKMQRSSAYCAVALVLLGAGCASKAPVEGRSANVTATGEQSATSAAATHVDRHKSESQIVREVDMENSVFFSRGKTDIDEQGMETLRNQAARISENPGTRVTLVGYTDNLGSPAYNLAIAEKRVRAVFEVLRRLGVGASQMRKYSLGNEKNSSTCRTEKCRRLMRRVTITY